MADYGVNINLRVKGQSGLDRLNAKVKEITKSVDNIRGIDIMNPRNTGGAAGKGSRKTIKQYRQDMEALVKTVNKSRGAFGKTANQQMAAADALQEYANSLTLGTKAQKAASSAAAKQIKNIDLETTAIIENTKAKKNNNDLANKINQGQGNNQFPMQNPKGFQAALTSGAISGAFPLLFGQGLLGGAAGFAGGFAGTKLGGKMGGFAGGLIATAVLQQITTFVTNINTLGNAFNELNPNIEQLTTSLGIAGTVEAERLKILEQSEGRHVSLAAATEKMNQAIGKNGVRNLKEFAESSRLLGNEFKKTMTKIQAALAPFFKFLADASGAKDRDNARLATLTGDEKLLGMRSELAILQAKDVTGASANKQKGRKISALKAEIKAREELLAKEGASIELGQLRNDQFNLATKAIRSQNTDLKNQINLGTLGAEVEREKLRIAKEMDIPVSELTEEMLTQIDVGVRLRDQLEKQLELHKAIAGIIKEGITDAIMGAIEGTKTLGDVARQVFTQISRALISSGVDNLTSRLNIPGFRAAGGPVKGGGSYIVGERGPELFTPKSSGMITPNNQLGGSTNVVVNVDAKGSSVEGEQGRSAELGRVISAAVQSEIVNQQRPGGLLA